MKVILTGSSGFIGHEVLKQCLEAPFITSIVALSRRDLPSSVTSNPKLRVTIMNDFLSYSDPILEDIKGANACIWYFQTPSYAERIIKLIFAIGHSARLECQITRWHEESVLIIHWLL